jgi:hypothetical protein
MKAIEELPKDFDGYPSLSNPWQHCKLGWKDDATACQRHAQLNHPGAAISEIFDMPFVCNFRTARAFGAQNIPDGPLIHSYQKFKTKAELDKHKELTGHKVPKKKGTKENIVPVPIPNHPPLANPVLPMPEVPGDRALSPENGATRKRKPAVLENPDQIFTSLL